MYPLLISKGKVIKFHMEFVPIRFNEMIANRETYPELQTVWDYPYIPLISMVVNFIFKHITYLQILYLIKKFVCINLLRFMPFSFDLYSLGDDENQSKTIFISHEKN